MGGINRIEICLIVIFAAALSGLLGQLLYVLWCRRRFHLQNQDQNDQNDPAASKELLYYFLCWHHHSRIAATTAPPEASPDSGDLAKWHSLYGPSRALFTIDEDEREDPGWLEGSEMKKTKRAAPSGSAMDGPRLAAADTGGTPPVSAAAEVAVVVEVEMETPFSTPCGSPVFYTPSPSPPREAAPSLAPGKGVTVDLEAGVGEVL